MATPSTWNVVFIRFSGKLEKNSRSTSWITRPLASSEVPKPREVKKLLISSIIGRSLTTSSIQYTRLTSVYIHGKPLINPSLKALGLLTMNWQSNCQSRDGKLIRNLAPNHDIKGAWQRVFWIENYKIFSWLVQRSTNSHLRTTADRLPLSKAKYSREDLRQTLQTNRVVKIKSFLWI